MAKLRSCHNTAQKSPQGDPKKAYLRYGLDLLNGEVRDNVAAGVLEPTMGKVKSLKSAYEAAVALLRIDDAIQCVPGESHVPLTLTCDEILTAFQQSLKESVIRTATE